MNDELVEQLLAELSETRKSFDAAIKTIKWNRFNTVVQYCLIVAVFLLGTFFVIYYVDDQHEACVRGNELRAAVTQGDTSTAEAIGIALTVLTEAPQETLQEYLDIYNQQDRPPALEMRDC